MVAITDSVILNILIGLIAAAVLVIGADKLINRCIAVAERLRISRLFVGLTILSVGTTLPETTTHIMASIGIVGGRMDMGIASGTVLGTNVGSDIFQQNFLIGFVALFGIVAMTRMFLKRDFLMMIAASIMLFIVSADGKISQLDGVVLAGTYMGYLWYLISHENHVRERRLKKKAELGVLLTDSFLIIVWLAAILISAEYILQIATFFVLRYSIGGSLVGVLTIGIIAALPELTTSIAAVLKKSGELSVGTLIGSNITNPLFAVGAGAMISGYSVPAAVIWYDLPVKILTALLIFWFFWKSHKLRRWQSFTLIGIYIMYIAARVMFFKADTFI
jgi:cation:H+ antiporter